MTDRSRFTLEELLVRHGAITAEDLARAQEVQRERGGELGRVLVDLGLLDEQRLAELTRAGSAPTPEGGATEAPELPRTLEQLAARLVALEEAVRPIREDLLELKPSDPALAAVHVRLERLEQLAQNQVIAVKALSELLIDAGVIDREKFFIKISRH